MITERGDGHATHVKVFARRIISQDVGGGLVAQRLIGGALSGESQGARNGGLAR